LLSVMEQLVQMQALSLILPRTVLDEFQRNKKRVAEDSFRSLSGVFKRVKEAVNKFGDPKRKHSVLQQLNDVDHQIPLLGESSIEAIGKIERLMDGAAIIEAGTRLRTPSSLRPTLIVSEREMQKGMRFVFVTHNKDDFSEPH